MLRTVLIFFLATISFCPTAFPASERELISLNASDGLSDLLVNSIYQDSAGYLWFGTEIGLDRYDGNQIKSFQFPDDNSGQKKRVNAITELCANELYVGNQQGLYGLSAKTGQLVPFLPDQIKTPVTALSSDGKNHLYIGTRQGLHIYDSSTGKLTLRLLFPDVMSGENEVADLMEAHGHGLWIATVHALFYLDYSTGKLTKYPFPFSNSISKISVDKDHVYIGTHGRGVVPFDIAASTWEAPLNFGNNIITSVTAHDDGNLYVATDGDGIFQYSIPDNRELSHISTSASSPLPLRSNSVYSMLIDNRGIMWVGYYQMGVDYTPHYEHLFDVYSIPGEPDLQGYPVRAIAVGDGHKVIGTRENLYFVDERQGFTKKFSRPQIDSNVIFCITGIGDKYYIGTYNGGMYVFDPTTHAIEEFGHGNSTLKSESIFAIVPDMEGTVWIGASNGLHRLRDGKEIAHYTSVNSQLPDGNVYEIFFDSTGRGWICTENGLAIWDGANLRKDRFPSGFIHKAKIRDIMEDSNHMLYFAPDRGPLFRSNLELSDFGSIEFRTGNAPKMITFIIEDNDGCLWLGSDKGLIRYDKRNHLHQFNNSTGIPNPVFTLCQPVRDTKGDLWFGNSAGLVRLDFTKFKSRIDEMHPSINISDLVSGGHSIMKRVKIDHNGNHSVELKKNENDILLNLSNFDYIPSQFHTIEYRLDGVDRNWSTATGQRPIHLHDLKGGHHLLRMRMPGDPNTETQLRIYKSKGINWPVLLVVTAIMLSVAGFIYISVKRRHRHLLTTADDISSNPATNEENPAKNSTAADDRTARYKTTRLTEEECKRLLKVLDGIMKNERPYTNSDLKSSQLAEMANTTSHALSFLFNQYMKKSYYDYVNEYRVAEFKRLVSETDVTKYTLTAMSQMCGFSSRASFFRHFKNVTGITPAEYIKQK